MKDPAPMKNQSQMMSMGQPLPIMNQSHSHQVMNNLNNQNSQMLMNQLINNNQSHMMMNQSQSQGILNNRGGGGGGGGGGYGMWPPAPVVDQLKFKNQKPKPSGFMNPSSSKPRNNKNWKAKKGIDKRNNNNSNWKELQVSGNNGGGLGSYNPPTLKELQQQNRLKVRRYFSKKKFNHNGGKSAPFAPRNTTSFLIRAKKSGGITSLVSPCPVTPAVLPTPNFSPSREVLVDMAKEEWGVDGYGSMKGLIRLRSSPGNNEAELVEDEEEDEGGSSESDVEEHLEVERRLDHDLSRFEMIYPTYGSVSDHGSYHLENRVDDQDTHIAQLEEENLILKERLFLMEREFDSLRKRLLSLERLRQGGQGLVEEVVENDSEHESYGNGGGRSMEEHMEEPMEENHEVSQYSEAMKECINGGNNSNGDILKEEEEEKMNLDNGIIEGNSDSRKVEEEEEGFVSLKDDDEKIGSR